MSPQTRAARVSLSTKTRQPHLLTLTQALQGALSGLPRHHNAKISYLANAKWLGCCQTEKNLKFLPFILPPFALPSYFLLFCISLLNFLNSYTKLRVASPNRSIQIGRMSLVPVAIWGLQVSTEDGIVPAISEIPATVSLLLGGCFSIGCRIIWWN